VTKRSSILHAVTPLAAIILAVGCSTQSATKADVSAVYDEQTGKLHQLKYDANKNGRADAIGYMDGTRVLRVEIDRDEDGKVERWEYYGADQQLEKVGLSRASDGVVDQWAYRGPDGTVTKVEQSIKRDGKVQRTEFYEKGQLIAVEEDADDNGAVDKWETYSGGALASVALDTNGTGYPTRRLVYAHDGSVRVVTGAAANQQPKP
jgi:hypothetical protein